jgi:hypothetical protein
MVRVKFNILTRVRNILTRPRAEWPVIEREFTEPAFLFVRYVAILALVPALAGFIGAALVGVRVSAGTFHEPFASAAANAVIGYLLAFLVVYVVALVIDLLTRFVGGERNFMNAVKLAAYAHTPVWLAGVFLLMPGLRFLTLLGLYSAWLLWTGLPVLMKTPRGRVPLMTAAIMLIAFVTIVALSLLTGFVLRGVVR